MPVRIVTRMGHRPSATRPSATRAGGRLAAAALLVAAGCGAAGSAAPPGPVTDESGAAAATTITAVVTPATATRTATRTATGPAPAAAAAGTVATRLTRASTAPPPTAHGLPGGFAVDDISAVSTRDWWILGSGTDGTLALARTVDGGHSWSDPELPAALSRPVAGGQQPGLAFATASAGSIVTAAGAYWATDDGGAHWRTGPAGAPATAVAATSDASLVLLRTTAGVALARGAAGSVGLTTVLAAGRLTTTIAALATSGRTVVVVSGNRTLISTDDGRTFATASGPCTADLGGQVAVAASTVVAWCATGMDGSGWISTDGGHRFAAVSGAHGANATAAAPTGSGATVIWADPVRGVHRRAAAASTTSGRAMYHVGWLGFTTPTDGFAIAGASAGGAAVAWHTVDRGLDWQRVAVD